MESASSGNLLSLKNASYLHARDPSILAFNRPNLADVKMNLIAELGEDTVVNAPTKEADENIRVYLRIKNGYEFENLYEISDNTLVCNVPSGSHCMRNIRDGDSVKKMYTFTKIFQPETTQTEIFNAIVKPKVLDFINGQNSTLLTYGASGSGKTFTVIGTDEEPGVVPRFLEYLFRTLPQLSSNPKVKPLPTGNVSYLDENGRRKEKQARKYLLNASSSMNRSQHVRTYTAMQQRLSGEPVALLEHTPDVSLAVWVSFAEIYNEQIYDLLLPDPPRGQQRTRLRLGCSNGRTYIKDLSNVSVTSGLEAYEILQYGTHNINYAATNLNSHSSRSHSIFTIKLVQVSNLDGGTFVSTFNFCDLAGCERSKKTMNVGDRLKESNNINTSLLVLGRCITAIRDSQKQNDNKLIPFRESKLTQLFQKALGGQEDIAMIVTISPKRDMFDETQHVLNFSAVAQDIAIIESKPAVKKKNRFSLMAQERRRSFENSRDEEDDVESLQNMVFFLQTELERVRDEYETNEKINRDYMVQGFNKVLEDMRESMNKREKEVAEFTKRECDLKMNRMKAHYERLLKDKKEEVVVVDSSDEEDDWKEEMKEKLTSLEAKVIKLELESQLKEEQLKKEQDKVSELQRTISEGVEEVMELEDKIKELEKDNREWKRICLNLEMEVEKLQEFNDCRTRESDSPEEDEEPPPTPKPSVPVINNIYSMKKFE